MAEIFVERMRYLLSEISLWRGEFTLEEETVTKVAASLDKFQSTLGDHLHDAKFRKLLEDNSEALSWMKELEDVTYKMEDAVGKWRLNSAALDARLDRIQAMRRFALLAQCFFPLVRWGCKGVGVLIRLNMLASAMESNVEALLLKGKKLVNKVTRLRTTLPDEDDQGLMASSVREGDRNRVLEHLLNPENGSKPVFVSIVGFGGSGKTALARSLYNHDSVEQHFQVRVWVRVASIFDGRKIATKLLDSLRIQYPEEESDQVESSLLELLCKSFSGKTVLAVFDDVWADVDDEACKSFINKVFENSDHVGSRILVTRRSQLGLGIVHTLAPLSMEECKLIMKSVAKVEISLDGSTGEELVKRCEGSALVAKILGVKLRSKESILVKIYNEYVEEVCMVRFPQFYNIYENLLPHMKPCLLSCVNFPKSTVLDSEKIITFWMSQGYLGYHTAGFGCSFMLLTYPDVERRGVECLSGLIGHSFFEEIASKSIHKPSSDVRLMCKIPDDVHDFLTYMAEARDDVSRSFSYSPQIPVNSVLFQEIQCITALLLSSCQLHQLPDEVGLLSRLQYLDLSDNPLKRLPATICKLHYLEFLDVYFCYLLSGRLPDNIGELKEMRHLRMNHTTAELLDLPYLMRPHFLICHT